MKSGKLIKYWKLLEKLRFYTDEQLADVVRKNLLYWHKVRDYSAEESVLLEVIRRLEERAEEE